MGDSASEDEKDWRERFRAVAQAQGRYLFLLLAAAVFYWALDAEVTKATSQPLAQHEVPIIGIKLDAPTVWATASTVLALIALAGLGTFPALRTAYERCGQPKNDERAFERLDTVPTAIDFMVYSKRNKRPLARLGLLTYPLFVSLVYIEAWLLWSELLYTPLQVRGRWVFLSTGALFLAACIPRLLGLWKSKVTQIWDVKSGGSA